VSDANCTDLDRLAGGAGAGAAGPRASRSGGICTTGRSGFAAGGETESQRCDSDQGVTTGLEADLHGHVDGKMGFGHTHNSVRWANPRKTTAPGKGAPPRPAPESRIGDRRPGDRRSQIEDRRSPTGGGLGSTQAPYSFADPS
jgi:hypothetical protein